MILAPLSFLRVESPSEGVSQTAAARIGERKVRAPQGEVLGNTQQV